METTAARFLQPACTAPKPEEQGQHSVSQREQKYITRVCASDFASKVTHKVEIGVTVTDMSDHGQVELSRMTLV